MKCRKILLYLESPFFHFPPSVNAANILSEKGASVYVYYPSEGDVYRHVVRSDVNLICRRFKTTGVRGVVNYFVSLIRLFLCVRRYKLDLIFSYDAKTVLNSFVVSKLTGVKWVYQQHDFWENPLGFWQKLHWKSERLLLKYADFVIFPQQDRLDFFTNCTNSKFNSLLIYNGPRLNWQQGEILCHPFMVKLKQKFKHVLIYQGGVAKEFCLDRIIDVAAKLDSSICLLFLGMPRYPTAVLEYETYIHSMNLGDRVFFFPEHVEYADLPRFTKFASAAFAIPISPVDVAPFNIRYLIGASNKITEYVATGIPVFFHSSQAVRNFLINYPIGFENDILDTVSYAKMIHGVLNDKEILELIRNRNTDIFINSLNFDVQFSELLRLI
jgi:glycosyltransferase involved in cell wall biosynthesis